MKLPSDHYLLPGGVALSLTLRGDCAECHIWAGADFEETDVFTGAGFFRVMRVVRDIVTKSGARSVMITACDDRRQKVFDYYAKKCGCSPFMGTDPEGDPCEVWRF